jgi:hypothetical protein
MAGAAAALIPARDPISIFRFHGHGERTFIGGLARCNRPCCLLNTEQYWRSTPISQIVYGGDAGGLCAKLGALHADYLSSDQAQADFTNIITKQRKLVRNVAFTEVKVGAAIGDTHARVSGALVAFHRFAYDHFDAFDGAQLHACRSATGYPTMHPNTFPRIGFEARDVRLKAPIYLHTLKKDAFTQELKLVFMIKVGGGTATQFYDADYPIWGDGHFKHCIKPFAHHDPNYTGDLNPDPHAFEKVKAFRTRIDNAESVSEEDEDIEIHPEKDTQWCCDGTVDYSHKGPTQALAALLFAKLSSSYKSKYSTMLTKAEQEASGNKRRRSTSKATTSTTAAAALGALMDCITVSKHGITTGNMRALHEVVCPDSDHTQGKDALLDELDAAVDSLKGGQ